MALAQSQFRCYVEDGAHLSSSIVSPGNGVTSEPVAMIVFFAFTVVVPPSSRDTSISCGDLNLPHPLTYSTCEVIQVFSLWTHMQPHDACDLVCSSACMKARYKRKLWCGIAGAMSKTWHGEATAVDAAIPRAIHRKPCATLQMTAFVTSAWL